MKLQEIFVSALRRPRFHDLEMVSGFSLFPPILSLLICYVLVVTVKFGVVDSDNIYAQTSFNIYSTS
jgi:hypothetical protein